MDLAAILNPPTVSTSKTRVNENEKLPNTANKSPRSERNPPPHNPLRALQAMNSDTPDHRNCDTEICKLNILTDSEALQKNSNVTSSHQALPAKLRRRGTIPTRWSSASYNEYDSVDTNSEDTQSDNTFDDTFEPGDQRMESDQESPSPWARRRTKNTSKPKPIKTQTTKHSNSSDLIATMECLLASAETVPSPTSPAQSVHRLSTTATVPASVETTPAGQNQPPPSNTSTSLPAPPTTPTPARTITSPEGTKRKQGQKIVCPTCGKTFGQRNHLEAHIRLHTGERPFVCEFPGCTKAFTQIGHRIAHYRVHTGEKPFVCPFPGCGRGFTQRTNMRVHMRVHKPDQDSENPDGNNNNNKSSDNDQSDHELTPQMVAFKQLSDHGEGLVCPVAGCGRVFRCEKGLKVHISCVHHKVGM